MLVIPDFDYASLYAAPIYTIPKSQLRVFKINKILNKIS
jgi:hypothetical protein